MGWARLNMLNVGGVWLAPQPPKLLYAHNLKSINFRFKKIMTMTNQLQEARLVKRGL